MFAGVAVVLAGGLSAAGARYAEERTAYERNRSLREAEKASIEADPDGELEELVGLNPRDATPFPDNVPGGWRRCL